KKSEGAGIYNTPVLKGDVLYGITTAGGGGGFGGGGGGGGGGRPGMGRGGAGHLFCLGAQTRGVPWEGNGPRRDCGAILDAGSVLLGLTRDSNLVAFEPNSKEFKEVARFKVAETPSWTCPIVSGNRVFVKDRDAVTLWVIP